MTFSDVLGTLQVEISFAQGRLKIYNNTIATTPPPPPIKKKEPQGKYLRRTQIRWVFRPSSIYVLLPGSPKIIGLLQVAHVETKGIFLIPKPLDTHPRDQHLFLKSNLKHGCFTSKFANCIWTHRFVLIFSPALVSEERTRKFIRASGFRCGSRPCSRTSHDWGAD